MPKTQPKVAILSLWRNDSHRALRARVGHLLSKTYANRRYIWVVGDSDDDTEQQLRELAAEREDVTIVRHDTGIAATNPDGRLRRLSLTVNAGLDELTRGDNYVLLHESDLTSPEDVIERLISVCAVTGGDVAAGWVTLGEGDVFYDTYAYRKDGLNFINNPPYHRGYRSDEPFEVDSVGSVWLAPAAPFKGRGKIRAESRAVIDIMRALRAEGLRIFVDPTLRIVQRRDLYVPHRHARD